MHIRYKLLSLWNRELEEMGKASQAAVYRAYINKMKKKTKKKNEEFGCTITGMLPSPSRRKSKEDEEIKER